MLTYEVLVNDRRVALAGAEDLGVLTTILTAAGRLGRLSKGNYRHSRSFDLWLTVGGLTSRAKTKSDEHVDWVSQRKLKPGDHISIFIGEGSTADAIRRRRPVDQKLPQAIERREFKWVKKRYLELREKYETPQVNKPLPRTRRGR